MNCITSYLVNKCDLSSALCVVVCTWSLGVGEGVLANEVLSVHLEQVLCLADKLAEQDRDKEQCFVVFDALDKRYMCGGLGKSSRCYCG